MQRRLITQFLMQVGFLSFLLVISLVSLFIALGYFIADSESYHNIHNADYVFFESSIKKHDESWQLDQKFKEAIRQQDG